MSSQPLLAYCTCPNPDVADRLARTLVEERLAACVSRVPGVVSTYRWQGQVEVAAEVLLLIKTTQERFEALRTRLVELHPYDVPEVIACAIAAGHTPYLDWLRAGVAPD
ncbi:MAG TPA: divalent-cation tolerance protein CutA [Rhodanobacteraceae bacterium]|nr:divalent-cation tolerance protein CutA [Rhodanobacteraceae bacterium]